MLFIAATVALLFITLYAIVSLVRTTPAFFKFGGNPWQYFGLLLLATLSLLAFVSPFVPAVPLAVRQLAPILSPASFAVWAILSWRCVVVFETSGTALSRKAMHSCNAMLLASVFGFLIIAASWLFTWFVTTI